MACMQAAIKFYLQRAAFDAEKELYMDTQLKKMMPATLAIEENIKGDWRTPYGYVFPPFVIIERGQSLDEWARDNHPDFITIFQARPAARMLHMRAHNPDFITSFLRAPCAPRGLRP
jgi:hypothetical protein